MKRGLLLVTLFLIMKLHFSHSRREETGSRTASSDVDLKQNILRRLAEPDPDSFYGMLGKRNAAEQTEPDPERETDELFFGLMGKRSSDSDNSPWRREYPERRGIFLNKFRLRSLQGL
uniref:Neuromedin-K n=1 Tax=Xiphophorus couchianus TaxID=32473 RepID=A0A3B5LKJ6_9TELE